MARLAFNAVLLVLMLVFAWMGGRDSAFKEIAERDARRTEQVNEAVRDALRAPDTDKALEDKRWLRD